MPHPVQQRVAAVVRRVRRLRRMYALGLWLIIAIAIIFLMGFADFVLRFDDPGLRYLTTACVVVILGGLTHRLIYPALVDRPSDLETAQQIERHFPQLDNRLSSSIAFLEQSEGQSTAGSVDLRRAVVSGMAAELERLDFGRCLDAKQPRRVVGLSVAACLIVALVCIWQWPSAALATRRLAMPWKEQPWPRRNQLEFVEPPLRIAIGSDFAPELVDRNGNLPASVQIYYWFEGDDEDDAQRKEMKYFDDRMVHRLENVTRSLKYRAVGGDDDTMPWMSLEVVEPPRVESVTIRLHPPAYTAWPAEPSGGNIHALVGTVIELAGRLSKPASSVTLRVDDGDEPLPVSLRIDPDGLGFQISAESERPWIVTESAEYWFDVADETGLSGEGDLRWSVRAVPDEPPSVSLEKPAANSFVTPDALVSLRGMAKDDLAIQTISLTYRRSDAGDDGQPQVVPIYQGPDPPHASEEAVGIGTVSQHVESVSYDWDLAQLPGLEPGQWIDFELSARDYLPRQESSTSRRLTIISIGELEERIAARRSFILGQLAEVLRVQREVRSETRALVIAWEELQRFRQQDVDRLQSAELRQRQVGELLSDPSDGVETQITTLLDELRGNRINSPEVSQRMNELLVAVREISLNLLPEIQRELINVSKAARASLRRDDDGGSSSETLAAESSLIDSLASAGGQQDAVIAALEALLGDFSKWDSYHRFSRELIRLQQAQDEVRQDTDRMRLEYLAKAWDELTPEQRSDLRRTGQRQAELARQFVRLQTRMEQMRAELADRDPAAAETLADALNVAQRTAIGGQMRDSGRRIDENQLGPAAKTQQAVLQNLQDMIDTLVHRREHELDRRVEGLSAAQAELQALRRRLKELKKELQQAADEDDWQQRREALARLQTPQQELAEQANRLARQLQRLSAQRAAEAIQRAAAELERSATSAQQGDGESALEHAENAERSLADGENQLNEEKRQAEQDLASEQMARFAQRVGDLLRRQQSVAKSTAEFEPSSQEQGRLTRVQAIRVARLAREQRALATDTGTLADPVAAAEAFVLGLRGVLREMDRAARGLERGETESAVQEAQQNAMTRLAQMLEALAQDPSLDDQQPDDSDEGRGGDEGEGQSPAEMMQRLAELKLLKLMQLEINRQTTALESQRQQGGDLPDEQLNLLDELSREQGRLAELIQNFGT